MCAVVPSFVATIPRPALPDDSVLVGRIVSGKLPNCFVVLLSSEMLYTCIITTFPHLHQ